MRQVKQPIPYEYVVTPEGNVKRANYGVNISGCLEVRRVNSISGGLRTVGRPRLAQSYAEAGWILLRDAYEMDSRPDVREKGMAIWEEFDSQLARRAHGSYKAAPRDNGKTSRQFPAQFPVEWVPEEVIARREGRSDVTGPVFQMPTPPKADKPKRGKASQ